MLAPYEVANSFIEGIDVVVNTQKAAAYRAPGSPVAAFAAESVIDEICEQIEMDPVEFRVRNAAREGSRQPTGPVFRKIGFVETLQAALEHPHLSQPLTGPNRGRGVAAGAWFNSSGPASAVASVNPDGTISLVEGSPDIGGSRAAMAMQVLRCWESRWKRSSRRWWILTQSATARAPAGSGVTFKMGTACHDAAQDIKQQMIERAARIWDVSPEDVEYNKVSCPTGRTPS